jgi:Kef-type K+ transport system membrane component KefB
LPWYNRFPGFARIVQERGIHKTRLGAIVITCAAADDITALLINVVIAIVAGDFVGSLYVTISSSTICLAMLYIVKPFLKRIGDLYSTKDNIGKPVMAIFFFVTYYFILCRVIGYSCPFGGFMMGPMP